MTPPKRASRGRLRICQPYHNHNANITFTNAMYHSDVTVVLGLHMRIGKADPQPPNFVENAVHLRLDLTSMAAWTLYTHRVNIFDDVCKINACPLCKEKTIILSN